MIEVDFAGLAISHSIIRRHKLLRIVVRFCREGYLLQDLIFMKMVATLSRKHDEHQK